VLKGILSGGTGVEELQQEKAIWTLKYKVKWIADRTCYELKSLELDNRTTLILSNTKELDKKLFYKLVFLI